MQHAPPWDIFNAKKIILKLDLFMRSLKKIGKEMPKIESEKPIYNVNKGHNSAIPRHYFSISTLIPSLKKIGEKMPKIESENKFLTSIKGYKLCT